ncbi:MAG: PAS domain S-box protein [Betaproteobacteria bacterium]|nr:PAS domain S-box protein [Betaproteobacteria bacterium]
MQERAGPPSSGSSGDPAVDLAELALGVSPGALVVLDDTQRVQWWNAGAEEVFGYPAAEALGQRLDELVAGTLGGRDSSAVFERARQGQTVLRERICRRRDGLLVHVNESLRARPGPGGALFFVAALSDVTALRVQRDAQLVQARYQGLLEHAPDAIVIVNDIGRIVLFNGRAREMFGHEPAAIIGEPIEALLPARLRAAHVRHRTGYLDAPRMRPMGLGLELHGVRRNGEEFPVEISLSPIDSDSGRLVMSAIRDTSERKRFEQALREKNDELERAIRAKDLFLATMSHELRTPLNAIIGFTGLMLMKLPGPLNAAQERQLTLVQSSGQHLLSLINDLLDLAKIESGRVELTLEPVRCLAVLEEAAATLRPAASTKGLTIIVATDGGELHVQADRRALQQIVLNLGSNAVKFSQRGIVRLEARANASNGDGQRVVELAVADEGVGISTEDQARLFQPFMQVGAQARRPAEGTGLGLHLSRKLAELMQSDLRVQSEPGVGSRFSLRLPRIEPPAAAGGSPPAEP